MQKHPREERVKNEVPIFVCALRQKSLYSQKKIISAVGSIRLHYSRVSQKVHPVLRFTSIPHPHRFQTAHFFPFEPFGAEGSDFFKQTPPKLICIRIVDLMRTQWNRVLKELYDWHTLINSETLKYYANQPA